MSLITCILPTQDRRHLVPLAISYFLRQDYPARELLIVDDGKEAVEDLVPDDPRIQYLRLSGRHTIGAKRNLACEAALGTYIAHWDDDDWSAPWRLSYQMAQLEQAQADASGLSRLFFYAPATQEAWQYIYPPDAAPWVAGGTLLYRRTFWQKNPFPDIDIGEDTRFVWAHPQARILALPDPSWYVAFVHPGNTSPKNPRDPRWHPQDIQAVPSLMGLDLAPHAAAITTGQEPAASTTPPLDELLRHPSLTWDGWAISRCLALALWKRLETLRPQRILELGSGTSTAVLAAFAARHGASVVTLEHDPQYLDATRLRLQALGLQDTVTLLHAPCTQQRFEPVGMLPSYTASIEGPFDFMFVDGPPRSIGRMATLFAWADHLNPGWELWLKDGNRRHEQACVATWGMHYSIKATATDQDPSGIWALKHQPDVVTRPAPAVSTAPPVTPAKPLVSCVMPTFDRRHFIPQALAYFQRQSYPNLELIVIDDGTDPIQDLLPHTPTIRYIRLHQRHTIGAKRNRAFATARGEYILFWDDDDWYGPGRVSAQVAPLIAGTADVTGLGPSLLFDSTHNQFWLWSPQLHAQMFYQQVIGGSLAFRRALLHHGARCPEQSIAEDAALLRQLSHQGARLQQVDSAERFIYVRHQHNSWQFTPGYFLDRAGWQPVQPPTYLPPQDHLFFASLSQGVQAPVIPVTS